MIALGLDIGSNSVGSAWVDTDRKEVHLSVSVFPAGVEEKEEQRGAPKNQARRQTRQQRRTIGRRARRKRALTRFLMEQGLLPRDPDALQSFWDLDPWQLRCRALAEPLAPHKFGRILMHLAQRRGAVGVVTDPQNPDEGKVKEGMDRLKALLNERGAKTVGQLLADMVDQRRQTANGVSWNEPIRNRQYRMPEEQMLFAPRELIRQEFHRIVEVQRSFRDSELAPLLSDELVRRLDDPSQNSTWRHRGLLFGQRHTYWDTGTLGRCALEPTERCVPIADRHASYFRVVETVNNIRIETRGQVPRPLTAEERDKLIRLLRGPLGQRKQKGKLVPRTSASVTDLRTTLGLGKASKMSPTRLNIEADEEREINTDWFHREIVHGAFSEARWDAMTEQQRESVNRAVLKFDPDQADDAERLRSGAAKWWGLDADAAERLVAVWKARPKLEKRLNLSRRAILNLLPYMERFDEPNNRWPTQQEARKAHARGLQERFEQTGECVYELAASRYSTGALGLTAPDRYYMGLEKHWIKDEHGQPVRDQNGNPLPELPPAPMLSNPVVRKAIHEVRRHLLAYLRKFRRKPDRVVIEFARGVKDTAKRRNAQLAANREREKQRKLIEEKLRGWRIQESNWRAATLRVRLCQEQNGVCPFSLQGPNANRTITEKMAAEGRDVEVEHIIPEALTGKTMAFNNLVLCYREANRGKGMRTPLDWLGPEGVQAMLQRLEHAPIKANRPKWERLQAPTPDEEGFRNSQLTDTAYAARQVAAYLADALYEGKGLPERGGERRIFTTKGEFTARLRADWGLHESTIDRAHGVQQPPTAEELAQDPHLEQASRRARKEPKDRTDHRHHAIDALAIGLVGPELLTQVGRMAREDREYRERTGYWPRREALPHPKAWETPEAFHDDVLAAFERLRVSHRPVKRRLVGAFHEQTLYGPVLNDARRFTCRIPALELEPKYLALSDQQRADIAAGRRPKATDDPPLKPNSYLVRDLALRLEIRSCLERCALNPDAFSKDDMKTIVQAGRLRMRSGVPIKSAVAFRTIAAPVIIPRKEWDWMRGAAVENPDPRTHRVYLGKNNHHIEIRERTRIRKAQTVTEWVGDVVTAFEATRRVRPPKNADGTRPLPQPAVDRADNEGARFVMSLAEGEMIYARRKGRPGEPADYFVVCKLDPSGRIHFAPHWDARKASEQDRWDVTPADLRNCGPEPGVPPYKVRVDPLGRVRRLERD